MANVSITVEPIGWTEAKTGRGTVLQANDKDYVLYIGRDGDENKAALINIRTGEAIHTLKTVERSDCVSNSELKSLNFKKQSPAVAY